MGSTWRAASPTRGATSCGSRRRTAAPVLWAPAQDAELDAFHWTGDGNLLVVTTRLAATAKRSLDPDGKRSKRYIAIFEERRPQVVTPKGQTVASLTFRRLGQIDVF